jgi:hypothetical protein
LKKLYLPELLVACLIAIFLLSGCGSTARKYAQEARSSYISARAVLVGVQEFPSQMETLLRSADLAAVETKASDLIDETNDLLPSASSAFRTARDKAEQLLAEGSEKYNPYADKLLELIDLNEEVISAYSEFIGLSNSVLGGIPYAQNPQSLMPTLEYIDASIKDIQELMTLIQQLEEEAESLYLEITK